MITGAGQLLAESLNLDTANLGQNIIWPGNIYSFELSTDVSELTAQALIGGRLQDVESAIGSVTETVTITQQVLDFQAIGFARDEIPTNSTSIPWDIQKEAIVPTTAPYVITDADITESNQGQIKLFQKSNAAGRDRRPLLAGTQNPEAKEFYADGTNGKLVFNAAEAGSQVLYAIPTTWSSGETIGFDETYDHWGAIKFMGRLYLPSMPNGIGIVFWRLTRSGIGNLSVTGSVAEVQATFKATTPASRRSPISFFNLDTLA